MALIAEKLGLKEKVAPPDMGGMVRTWLELYNLLSSSRATDYGQARPIPLTEINALSQMMPLPCSNAELISVIQAMDVVFLEHINKRKGK